MRHYTGVSYGETSPNRDDIRLAEDVVFALHIVHPPTETKEGMAGC